MNKKKAIIIAIAAVLLIGLTSAILIIGTRDKKESGVKAETTEAVALADKEEKAEDEKPEGKEDSKDTKEKAEEKKDTKKDDQEAEKDTVKSEITESVDGKQTEQPKTTEKPQTTTEQQQATEAPKQTEQPTTEKPKPTTEQQQTTEKQKVWHEPVYEDVWVVDVPAHTEKQVVYVKYTEECYCGFQFTSLDQWDVHLKDNDCAGYRTDIPIYVYEDVEVPEQGHYDKKLVKDGYWE